MMRGPKSHVHRRAPPDGGIETEVTPVAIKPWQKWPFVRGIYNMAENLVVGYRCLMRSADISMTEEEKEQDDSKFDRWVQQHLAKRGESVLMGIASFAGVALAIALFWCFPPCWWAGFQAGAAGRCKNTDRGCFENSHSGGLHGGCKPREGDTPHVLLPRR